MPATPLHHTDVKAGAWDADTEESKLKHPVNQATAHGMYAWFAGGNDDEPDNDSGFKDGKGHKSNAKMFNKNDLKLPHHFVGTDGKPGVASYSGVKAAMSRLSSADMPDGDRAAVKKHLQTHLDDHDGDDDDTKKNSAGELPRHRERALADSEGDWTLREDSSREGTIGTLHGHFAVFNRWTEINSMWEGRFMERIAPGAFTKTFAENRKGMRCLFQHGKDPQIGMKPLGPIRELDQDDTGAGYEVDLLDTAYNRDLKPGLKSGQYGASFRFQVIREEVNEEPERSPSNPDRIPERTVTEARVQEFGPVTFGAYADATAGLRSIDDEVLHPEREDLMRMLESVDPDVLQTFVDQRRRATKSESRESSDVEPDTKTEPSTSDAPPPVAPVLKTGATQLRAPRTPLRTTRDMEEPKWKL